MFRARIAALALVVVAVPAALVAHPAHSATGGNRVALSPLESGVLADINAYRQSHGLVPLRVSGQLTDAARQHSLSMAARGYFSHDSADGTSFWKRVQHYYAARSFRYWAVGENLLWSSPDVDASHALQMWIDSPPHRENLLTAKWREVGLSAVHVAAAPGAFRDLDVTIVTADFGVRR